jgi:transcriptional regulator with XRE-family HTH domain
MDNSKRNGFYIADAVSDSFRIPVKDRTRVLLLKKGISQNQLADKVGIAKGTMSKIVNEDWRPTHYVKIRMAEVLGCDSLVIFGDTRYWDEWIDKIKEDKIDG